MVVKDKAPSEPEGPIDDIIAVTTGATRAAIGRQHMLTSLPNTQMALRPGCVEFGWGHPALALLPARSIQQAAELALREHGAEMLVYGASQGPGSLIEQISRRLALLDGQPTSAENILISAGISQALDLLCTLRTQPGDIMLVESPIYHFALRIFQDHRLRLIPVAADRDGVRTDALEATLDELHKSGRQAKLLYTVPTYNNPTGRTLAVGRRPELLRLAAAHDVLLLEDDVYRELWFERPPPAALATMAPGNVVRLCSFSKILAPGLRLGWIVAEQGIVQHARASGLLNSGGGINHFTAHVVAEYLRSGGLDSHVADLRRSYRSRRDQLVDALGRHLPDGCRFDIPEGGFFIWIELPEGMDSAALLPHAEAAGVSYIPGTRFHVDGGGQGTLRLAFSLLPLEELEEGARRLGKVLHEHRHTSGMLLS